MSPADPDIVYALIESKKTGLYKSTDGGLNWDLVSTKNIGNRPVLLCRDPRRSAGP